jgi:hypothetical protein
MSTAEMLTKWMFAIGQVALSEDMNSGPIETTYGVCR